MTPERFQRILRSSIYSSISVRRDPSWSARHGFHPDAYLVWDKAPVSGEPYVVFVCQRKGLPVEPNQEMLGIIRAMDSARVHGGRKAWADEKAGEGDRLNAEQERLRSRAFRERFDYDFKPKMAWATNNHRTYGVDKSKLPS